MERIEIVSHQQAKQLLRNKFVVVLGPSVQRSIYKDIVLLLQKDQHLSDSQLKAKGEMSFEQDRLLEGGSLKTLNNGIGYREVRQYRSDHHLVKFYFLTKIYSSYMQTVLDDFRSGLKPDVVIVNSCVWDITRYNSHWRNEYTENLQRFFEELKEVLPKETLTIWNLTLPLGQNIKGGFVVPEIAHKTAQLHQEVVQANFLCATLADCFGIDVSDLHYYFRHSLHHLSRDGIHWNALAHRCITSLLLRHIAKAWGVVLPCSMSTEESRASNGTLNGFSNRFVEDSLTSEYFSFEGVPQPLQCTSGIDPLRWSLVPARPQRANSWDLGPLYSGNARFTDLKSSPLEFCGTEYNRDYRYHHDLHSHQQYVMRSRLQRNHFAPYPQRYRCNNQCY